MGPVRPLTALEPLPAVHVEGIELIVVELPVLAPLRTARSGPPEGRRPVLLVHVRAREAEGWAECAVETAPTYASEFTEAARLVLRDHLVPRAWAGPTGDALALGPALDEVRGHPSARAALELAVLDAQLRAVDRSLAHWLGATETAVSAGAALGLHGDVDELLDEATAALAAGAARLRVKIRPGSAATSLAALRAHVGPEVVLQADANGSFRLADDAHVAELEQLDALGLACLEQPLAPDDLVGSARLAERLATPICLDEPITSLGAVEAVAALGAAHVICLKPARVGGWPAARVVQHRCRELGLGVWLGGMLETAVGRAANLAVAALPGMTLPADLDPRPRYSPDLAEASPAEAGRVTVPTGPGTGAAPDVAQLLAATIDRCVPDR
jgi:O-succinylbenzoate synthase